MIQDLFTGLLTPFRAMRLILTRRELVLWSILPILTTLIAYYLLYNSVFEPFKAWIISSTLNYASGLSAIGWLKATIDWSLSVVFEVVFWIALAFLFAPFSNLAGLPVNDFLAEASEKHAGLAPIPRASWLGIIRLILIDFRKSIVSGLALLICLVLAFIPVLNIFALLAGWLLITFQYITYPQTRREQDTRTSLMFLKEHFALSLGFGIVISIGFSLPLINIVVPPIAVVGGTLLWAVAKRRSVV